MELSKRDYFAAKALTGLLARTSALNQGLNVHSNVAAEAFLYADEMLKLSKTLMDPVEIDPDKMAAAAAAEEARVAKENLKPKG